jgi:hypothetical protein
VNGQYGIVGLWGPGNGSANGLPATSPDGGNYVGADGAFQQGAITPTINGLVVGQTYAVSFDWAGAQQLGFNGPNTEQWVVGFGSDTQSTAVYNNSSHGFSGWNSTPAFHHWHHALTGPINRNFASTLPWLDRIFGTHYLPRTEWPAAYGIEAKLPDSPGGQLAYPLRTQRSVVDTAEVVAATS